ncbi:hypothetical protein SDC9_206134 [bioreactor metagenome]|uniref:Uncharacterized protein n=1 Tax=bioreactor metagenome TaxID=1076179 RepID=A0A645J6V9_9ZZZZ
MGQLHVREVCCHFFHDATPQAGALQDVGLINGHYFFSARLCQLEGFLRDAADLKFGIDFHIIGFRSVFAVSCPFFSEINAAGELAHHHEIEAPAQEFVLKG